MPETAEQKSIMDAMRTALDRERELAKNAESRIRELVRAEVSAARRETNRLLDAAVNRHGLSKAVVSRDVFNKNSRNHVYERLREHAATDTLPVESAAWEPAEVPEPSNPGTITAELQDEGAVSVHLDTWSDPGISQEPVTGTILFTPSGEVDTYTKGLDHIAMNPLLAGALYTHPTVQAAL